MNRQQQALEIFAAGTVIPATPLALDENRRFDAAAQKKLTRYYLDAGVGGIATAVHTTQFEIRDPEHNLLEPVLQTVGEEIQCFEQETGRTIVKVAGVCDDTQNAVREAELAKQYGYDAVLLSPGGLNHRSEEELIERTKAVAAVMPIIGFYLQQSVGGRVFSYRYWQRICEIENVIGIKCASFNRYTTIDVVRAVAFSSRRDAITLYTGNDDNIVVDLLTPYRFTVDGKTVEKRFEGGLLGHWSVCTKSVVAMFQKIKEAAGQPCIPQELLALGVEVTDANAAFFDVANGFKGCIAGIHEVLRRDGHMNGIWCLNPAETLSSGQVEEIDRVLDMYPNLRDPK